MLGNSTCNVKVNMNLMEMKELSASQLHLLLHPTDDEDDADLKESTNLVSRIEPTKAQQSPIR